MRPMLFEFRDLIEPSKLPKRRKYLNYYLLGFAEGEGCFSVSIKKQRDTKYGWVVDPVFHVTQHKDNRVILELFRRVFGCGRIIPKPGQEETILQYIVDNRRHLSERVIPFFKKHRPIVKSKEFDYFYKIVEALENGEHKNAEGLKKLIKMAYDISVDRKYSVKEIAQEIERRVGASETIR
jgi:hypothetical protein